MDTHTRVGACTHNERGLYRRTESSELHMLTAVFGCCNVVGASVCVPYLIALLSSSGMVPCWATVCWASVRCVCVCVCVCKAGAGICHELWELMWNWSRLTGWINEQHSDATLNTRNQHSGWQKHTHISVIFSGSYKRTAGWTTSVYMATVLIFWIIGTCENSDQSIVKCRIVTRATNSKYENTQKWNVCIVKTHSWEK